MSPERSKFIAGTHRGIDASSVFYGGSMAVGGGGEGGGATAERSRCAQLWQRGQQLEALGSYRRRELQQQHVAVESARKVTATGAIGSRKLATTRRAAVDVAPKRAPATTTLGNARQRGVARQSIENSDYKWHATGRRAAATANGNANGNNSGKRSGARGAARRCGGGARGRGGGGFEPLITKWLLLPQSNFRESSESTSDGEDQAEKANEKVDATTLSSMPQVEAATSSSVMSSEQQQQPLQQFGARLKANQGPSKMLTLPSQRILLADEPKQQQPKQQQQQQQQTLLLQANGVGQTTFVDNSNLPSAKPSPNSSSNTNSNSSNDYQTVLGISCSSSGIWCHDHKYDKPLLMQQTGGNRSVKLTATVIKIVPEKPQSKATTTTATKIAKATTTPTPTTVAVANKSHKRTVLKQSQQQQQQQLQRSPPTKPQQQQRATAAATTATTAATVAPKILRVSQHKVPRTIEDGIDISYQYFVSKPLARGKKPYPIRYLYRPMMRRLNQTPATGATTRHGRRNKNKTSKADTEPTDVEHVQPTTSPGSTDVESDSGTEQQEEQQQQQHQEQQSQQQPKVLLEEKEQETEEVLKPPPIVTAAKYLPFVKQVKKHPLLKEQQQQQQPKVLLEEPEEKENFSPPPLVVDAKYSSFVKQLRKHPMPRQQQRPKEMLLQQHQQLQQHLQQLEQQPQQQQQQKQLQLEQQHTQMLQQMQQQLQQQQQLIQEQQQQLLTHEAHQPQQQQDHPQQQYPPQQQQQQQQRQQQLTLLDYQPNVTRLRSVGGANICFHAPIRMSAGNDTTATTTAAAATTTATTPIEAATPTAIQISTTTLTPTVADTTTTTTVPHIAAVTYEDIDTSSCYCCKSVSFQMENNCGCNTSNICLKTKCDSKKKRKCKTRGKKKNRK